MVTQTDRDTLTHRPGASRHTHTCTGYDPHFGQESERGKGTPKAWPLVSLFQQDDQSQTDSGGKGHGKAGLDPARDCVFTW